MLDKTWTSICIFHNMTVDDDDDDDDDDDGGGGVIVEGTVDVGESRVDRNDNSWDKVCLKHGT